MPALLTRRRDTDNRRIHLVELTDAGEAMFVHLRDAAVAFDRRLRRGIAAEELSALEALLDRLASNVADEVGGAPWTELVGQRRRAKPR